MKELRLSAAECAWCNDVRQTKMQTDEPLVPEPSPFVAEITTEKLKRYKPPGTDQILALLIQAGGNILCLEIQKLINYIWNREELPQQWKEYVIIPIYKKGDKTYHSNYKGISLLLTTYKILSNILLSRLTSYTDKITGYYQCGF
jgi:hypothetical protein